MNMPSPSQSSNSPHNGQGQQPFNPGAGQAYGPSWRPNPQPRSQTTHTGPASNQAAPRPVQGGRTITSRGLTYFLWRFGDVQMIDALAKQWLRSVQPNMAGVYLLAFLALTFVTGVLTWFFDVRPSLVFANYVGQNAFNQPLPFQMDDQTASVLTIMIIGILSITPNLLEFFTVGLALQGNLAVDLALKAALVFDAITDAPGALAFAKTVVAFFTPDLPMQFLPIVPWVEVALAGPILLLATIVIETLFLSFLLATFRLFWYSMSRPRPLTPRP